MADEDKKEQVKTEEAQPKKGGLVKWVIIGLAALLVLGGGGFVSWKTFMQPAEKEVKEESGPVRLDLGPTVPLETFIVNLSGAAGERYLKVAMELELKEKRQQSNMRNDFPYVRTTSRGRVVIPMSASSSRSRDSSSV